MNSKNDDINRLRTIVSKVVQPSNADPVSGQIQSPEELKQEIQRIALQITNATSGNEDILKLFPDIEMCALILAMSVLAPNGMLDNALSLAIGDIKLPPEVKSEIADKLFTYINSKYKISENLPEIIKKILFTKGSCPYIIIPENSLQEMISAKEDMSAKMQLESYTLTLSSSDFKSSQRPVYLGEVASTKVNVTHLGIESYEFDLNLDKDDRFDNDKDKDTIINLKELNIEITENFDILLANRAMKQTVHKLSKETFVNNFLDHPNQGEKRDTKIEDEIRKLFSNKVSSVGRNEIMSIKTKDEVTSEAYGEPLVIELGHNMIVPVHSMNDPTDHIGYFIPVDQYGSMIRGDSERDLNAIEQGRIYSAGSDTSNGFISKVRNSLQSMTSVVDKMRGLESIYGSIIEAGLKKKIRAGIYGNNVDIASTITENERNNLYYIMLLRTIRGKQTKLLYVPKELIVYFAVEYRENGTGKSLLEKVSVLASIRAILMFTRLNSAIKNSTPTTLLEVQIDEKEKNPKKRISEVLSLIAKSDQMSLPIGETNIMSLTDWTTQIGKVVNFNHPSLPKTKIDRQDSNTNRVMPDNELEEDIQELIIMAFYLTPELVRSGYSADFATTVAAKNLMFNRRVRFIQSLFIPKLSEFFQKIAANDMYALKIITDSINNNRDAILKEFSGESSDGITDKFKSEDNSEAYANGLARLIIDNLQAKLPVPESNEATQIENSYAKFRDDLKASLDDLFNSEAISSSVFGKFGDNISTVKAAIVMAESIRWMSENNFRTEIISIFTKKNDEGGSVLDKFMGQMAHIYEAMMPFIVKAELFKRKSDDEIDRATSPETLDKIIDKQQEG